VVQLLTKPLEGGNPELCLRESGEGSFSPDGARIAYVPHIQSHRNGNGIAADKRRLFGSRAWRFRARGDDPQRQLE